MEYFVGIDLGTSSVRAVAVDVSGQTVAAGEQASYYEQDCKNI